ncbi:hypothetical protein KIP88_45630, partial [Bradyrhizobium sp. SRL28]|uniref:hypothetical protein n=1 Tax=Bradyrhizobium sp. SRL28 TaxID=2836178 RepID=UPI001BDF41BD
GACRALWEDLAPRKSFVTVMHAIFHKRLWARLSEQIRTSVAGLSRYVARHLWWELPSLVGGLQEG